MFHILHTYIYIFIYPESQSPYFVYPSEKAELCREKLFFSRVVLGWRPAYSHPCTFQHWPLKIFHLLRWRSSFNISNPPKLNHTTVHNASYTREIERCQVVTWLLILLYIAAMNAHSVLAKEKTWAALSTHNDGTCGIQLESRFTTRGNYPVRRTEWLSELELKTNYHAQFHNSPRWMTCLFVFWWFDHYCWFRFST